MIGKKIQLETDHKPLVPLFRRTILDSLPPRILRFRLCMMRFDYSISHVPGKEMYTQQMHCHAHLSHCQVPCRKLRKVTQSCSSVPLCHAYQPVQIVCRIIAWLNTLTVIASNSWTSAKEIGQSTKDSLWETFSSIGMLEENLPSLMTCFLIRGCRTVVP